MKEDNGKKIKRRMRRKDIFGIYTAFLLSVYQLIIIRGRNDWNFTKSMFYCIATLVIAFLWIISASRAGEKLRKPHTASDVMFLILLAFSLVSLGYKMFAGRLDWNYELIVLAGALSWYIYSQRNAFHFFLADILLVTGLVVYSVFYIILFAGEAAAAFHINIMAVGDWYPWLFITASISAARYCTADGKRLRSAVYFILSTAGLLLVLLLQNISLIYLTGGALLAMPLACEPEEGVAKRGRLLLFVWLFLLCNMRLILTMAGMETKLEIFSTGFGAFLEILAVTGGILFLLFLDNLPENAYERRQMMKKLRRTDIAVFVLYAGYLMLLLLSGEGQGFLPEKGWVKLALLSREWLNERAEMQSLFQLIYQSWGAAGCLAGGAAVLYILFQIHQNYKHFRKKAGNQMPFLWIMSFIIAVSFIFWGIDENTAPIYCLILSGAFHRQPGLKHAAVQEKGLRRSRNEADYPDSLL